MAQDRSKPLVSKRAASVTPQGSELSRCREGFEKGFVSMRSTRDVDLAKVGALCGECGCSSECVAFGDALQRQQALLCEGQRRRTPRSAHSAETNYKGLALSARGGVGHMLDELSEDILVQEYGAAHASGRTSAMAVFSQA